MSLIIGVPKERKFQEYRVAVTPENAGKLVALGVKVYIESEAGVAAGYSNEDYYKTGAGIVCLQKDIWELSDIIIKVKEPTSDEFIFLTNGKKGFAFYHLPANPRLKEICDKNGFIYYPYEDMIDPLSGSRPVLGTMSAVTGRLAPVTAQWYLRKKEGGSGVLFDHSIGTILGSCGVVGRNAYEMARGMGAQKIYSIDLENKYNDDNFLLSAPENIAKAAATSDWVICSAVMPKIGAPKLLTFEMVKAMRSGSVVIDIAKDEGGNFEGTQVTTHENPVYFYDGKIIYAVTNVPSMVARTSSKLLSDAALPFIIKELGL